MAPISTRSRTRPNEVIEQSFGVFCGMHETMDESGFAKFCESCKSVDKSKARDVFLAVVQNVHSGMDLNKFKAALGLLVNDGSTGYSRTDRELLTDKCFKSSKVAGLTTRSVTCRRASDGSHLQKAVGLKAAIVEISSKDKSFKSSRVTSRTSRTTHSLTCRRASNGSHLQKTVGIKATIVETNSDVSTDVGSDDDLQGCHNSDDGQHGFRWAPMAIFDSVDDSEETSISPSHKRTIRWCPADLEEEYCISQA